MTAGSRRARSWAASRVRTAVVAAALAAASLSTAACGLSRKTADVPRPHQAFLQLEGHRTVIDLAGCSLDGDTVFVVGHASSMVLQAVIDVPPVRAHPLRRQALLGGTAVTVDTPSGRSYQAIGKDALARMGRHGTPPGEIAAASVRGARVEVSGHFAVSGGPSPKRAWEAFDLLANCPPGNGA